MAVRKMKKKTERGQRVNLGLGVTMAYLLDSFQSFELLISISVP